MKKIKHKPVSSKTEKKQVSLLPEFLKEQRTRILLGIALALVSLYILFALIGFFFSGGIDQSLVDGPWGKIITNPEIEVSNPAGKIGAWISDLLINRWFGISSFILCYLLLLCSFRLGSIKVKNFSRRLFIGMCIILWISLFLGFLSESISNLFEVGTGYLFPGGGHGHFVSVWLNSLVGRIGTMLILILTFIAILFFGFERTFYKCVDYIKEQERNAKLEAHEKAKQIIVSSMERYAEDVANEQTVSTIDLPSDEMKGRLIGREGRNIRTIESVTGVDLIIDDTPEAIVISSFDPLRREIAKLTIETLIRDGRIHPSRIEEVYDKTSKDINTKITEIGNQTIYDLGLAKMDPELITLIGKLNYRTSYGQNALQHSREVANLAGLMAAELGENVALAKRAGLLHDIGKSIDFEVEGSHVEIGADLARKYHEDDVVINAIESHHGDKEATSVISVLVEIADTLSAARPGARNDTMENYMKRLSQLEEIGNSFEGVEKTFAVQAGREIRVMVKPEEVDEAKSYKMARDIKDRIEAEMQYPGTIKINVIRETRAVEEAK